MSVRHLPLLTTSASARYRSCPRSYWYTYEECVRPVYVDDAREFGTLGHRGLEVYMMALRDGAKPLEAVERGMSEIRRIENPFTQEAHLALLCGYHSRWENSGLTVLAVEQQYVTPLRNPATGAASRTWEHAGKIDAIVRDAAGDVWVLDDLTGIDKQEVEIVVEVEEYTANDGEVRHRSRVQWVNALGGLPEDQQLDEAGKAAFATQMKGLLVASRKKSSPNGSAPTRGEVVGDVPFTNQF